MSVKRVMVHITMSDDLKSDLEAVAKEEMLSLSSFCRTELARILKKRKDLAQNHNGVSK